MENATKAVLIAGAILLAMAIIAIAMYVYISSKAALADSEREIESVLVEAHNSKFFKYDKSSLTGLEARECLSKVINSNATVTDTVYYIAAEVKQKVKLTTEETTSTLKFATVTQNSKGINVLTVNSSANVGDINVQGKYSINISLYKNGLVSKIVLTEI